MNNVFEVKKKYKCEDNAYYVVTHQDSTVLPYEGFNDTELDIVADRGSPEFDLLSRRLFLCGHPSHINDRIIIVRIKDEDAFLNKVRRINDKYVDYEEKKMIIEKIKRILEEDNI